MTNQIRQATESDLTSIIDCAHQAYAVYVERIGREPSPMGADFSVHIEAGQVFIIGDDSSVFGYVVFYRVKDHIHLDNIAIQPIYQGRGLGCRLIAFVEDQARQRGYRTVELYTNEKMYENLELYPKLGYEEIDRRCEDGFDRVFYRKAL